jgi:hypothetical protein
MVSLAALMVPAGAAEAAKKKSKAKQPVVASVRPMDAEVGDTLSIHGKNFLPGKGKNTVVFRRDGSRAIFVKSDVSTRKLIKVVVPGSLLEYMTNQGTAKLPTQFRVRILAKRFGKSFTTKRISPTIGPDTPPPPPLPPSEAKADGDCDGNGVTNGVQADDDSDGLNDDVELSLGLDPCKVDTDGDGLEDTWEFDCDRDRVLNRDESDDDNDLLSDDLEATLMTNPCSQDSDGDGVEDGYEYRSAVDLNDDEYQQPNVSLPYPGKRPYANPLNADSGVDYDGDGLTLKDEYELWRFTYQVNKTATRNIDQLSYSDGLAASAYGRCGTAGLSHPSCEDTVDNGRRVPTLVAATYAKWYGTGNGNVCDGAPCNEEGFISWAERNGYRSVHLSDAPYWWSHSMTRTQYDLLDVNRDGDVSDHWPDAGAGESFGDPGVPATREMNVLEATPFDLDSDGYVSDDERDEDADGLTNYDETRGRATRGWWGACYGSEAPYKIQYASTSHVDADSDGDGIRDGADDQDHDDVPNLHELSRVAASGLDDTQDGFAGTWGMRYAGIDVTCKADEDLPQPPAQHHPDAYGWVNPYNPCLPFTAARTCERHPDLEDASAPYADGTPIWHSLN